MLSWKEKVADRLCRLLGDSPSSSTSSPSPSPSINGSEHQFQAIPLCIEESSSPKKISHSSFFLPFLHTSSGVNGHESNKTSHPGAIRPLPVRSQPRRWKAEGFNWKDRPLSRSAECGIGMGTDELIDISEENPDHMSDRNISSPHGIEEASISHDPAEFFPYLTENSAFISSNLYEFLQSSLPNIVKGCHWVLLYSTLKHGISLRTLLRRSASLPGPCLLIVGDMHGAVFGGLFDSPPKPTTKRKYQGTNQTFVFTTIYGEPRLFRATGANRYYYLCLNDVLAFGGGGNFALCLDEDLLRGTSGPCETYGSLCLAHSPEFELKNVELWGFSHSSRSLT